jgi:1-acyl-sn-glycerol-3-phosphate acyltransferase
MRRRLARGYRIVGTGISFAIFGIWGVGLGLFVCPVLSRIAPNREAGELRVQRVVHLGFRAFVRVMMGFGLLEVRTRGAERLQKPDALLIVANHPTLIDVVLLGHLIPQLDCVVKKEAWSNPCMRSVVDSAGYIPNDLGEDLVDACTAHVRRGRRLLLFPEGTRSPKGQLGSFRRGAAHVALSAGVPIVPIVIRCEPPSLMRGQKWYNVPETKMVFTIEICEALHFQPLVEDGEARGSAARKINRALRDFYTERLQTPNV